MGNIRIARVPKRVLRQVCLPEYPIPALLSEEELNKLAHRVPHNYLRCLEECAETIRHADFVAKDDDTLKFARFEFENGAFSVDFVVAKFDKDGKLFVDIEASSRVPEFLDAEEDFLKMEDR